MSDPIYRCPICGGVYSPAQAAELGFHCHAALERGQTGRGAAGPASRDGVRVAPYVRVGPPAGQVAVQVIPPAQNEVDPTVVEQILGTITEGPLSLELAGDENGQRMFLRGPEAVVRYAQAQLQAGYGQVALRELPAEEDPVHSGQGVVAFATCSLRRPSYFPLRTWRQFGGTGDLAQARSQGGVKVADPIRVLVGGLDGLGEGEQALVQLLLLRRAPEDWADPYQGSAQEMDFRVRAASGAGQARGALLAVALLLLFLDAVFFCHAASAVARYGLGLGSLGPLSLAVLLAIGSGAAGVGLVAAWRRLTTQLNANPQVVRQKVSQPAFHAQLRFWGWAKTEERARELVRRLLSAYAVYNLAEGNGLQVADCRDCRSVHPALLLAEGGAPTMLLNLTEVAGMWHMPMGELPERMGREMFFRRVPQEITRPQAGGVFLGRSTKGGDPVYLPPAAVESGVFIAGKPQTGKSTLMEKIAVAAMRNPRRALVVVDPHQDMVRRLMGLVPVERLDDVRCLDLAGTGRFPGINLLDMALGVPIDKVVSDLVTVGQALWTDYWGPRMEAVLRYAARTVALINRRRVAEGRPDEQLSVLFIPRLLLAKDSRREAYLLANLPPAGDPDVDDVLWWWRYYYQEQRTALIQQVISPVVTKIYHLSGVEMLRSIFGQPRTTVDFRQAIRDHGIVLVNTGGAFLGQDVGAFVGSLVLNYLNAVTREQGDLPREERTPITVVVDEFQSIRGGVPWRDFLGQLRKFGAQVVLGTQSLAGMREDNRELPGEILAGVMTVVVFQVNAEDAGYLRQELDNSVPPESMTNLPPFHAYVKTVGQDRRRLPMLEVELQPPEAVDPAVLSLVYQRMARYALPAAQVDLLWQRMQGESVDDYNAVLAQQAALRARLGGGEPPVISREELLAAARAQGTRSTQNYGPPSGNIGRGLGTRRSGRPRRSGGGGGYRVVSD